ncbi:Flp pilus assembly protein CpaB [Aneurinibacillus tyrosinisolvens]|uniref:Flp pilus assembly protein CpaB n=1 Tax=Aneurinibacillus tyrosinisolvens TaxID=1443435 RepID=UPI00063F0EEC|nr:RcpC/CpaB family pilus assembly protein [Aneurinibacillus tyrosinisolvens]
MNKKNKRIILSAVGAVVGSLAIFSSATPSNEPVKVLAAYELKNNVPIDKKITEQDIKKVDVKETEVKDWMVRDASEVVGKHAKVDMYAGEQIRKDRLSDKEVLKFAPDERTMNIEVNLARTAGLPKPGDRVDIMAAVQKGDANNPVIQSSLVMQNVYVTKVMTKEAQDMKEKKPDDTDTRTYVPAFVTVKVSVQQAVVLNALAGNEKVKLRLLGRTFASKNIQ